MKLGVRDPALGTRKASSVTVISRAKDKSFTSQTSVVKQNMSTQSVGGERKYTNNNNKITEFQCIATKC